MSRIHLGASYQSQQNSCRFVERFFERSTNIRSHVKLGKLFGVKLGLHYSWLLIALLITFSLAARFQAVDADWSPALVWGSALVTSLLFFAGLLAHELSHAVVAKSFGLPVRSITLFALGGVAQIEKDATQAYVEFWMGIVGPITSAVIGLVLLAIARSIGWSYGSDPQTPGLAILVWLGFINLGLALFNMIPGFPLDGGRVLRAIIWWITGNVERATRSAAKVGQLVAIAFIIYGVVRFFSGAGFGGLWLSFIGWFLLQAAGSTYFQFEAAALLEDLRARDLMSRDCTWIDADLTLRQFVDEYILRSSQRCFIVIDKGLAAGLITAQDVRTVDRIRWDTTPVREAMRAIDAIRSVKPDTPVLKAIEVMARENVNQLPVIENQHIEGMVSRANILHVLQSRSELKAAS
jgi:Zn-dependent protease/predicted transcriptional regulator